MRAECLPIAQLPHVSRLFADYAAGAGEIHRLVPSFSDFPSCQRSVQKSYDDVRRKQVCDVLERQNRAWGASEMALANIGRLRQGATCAVTGQQVGLFGGPLYSLFKALTVISLAEQVTGSGAECVPVFWLATSDHDLAEVNTVTVAGNDGSLHSLTTQTHGLPGAPVRDVHLADDVASLLDELESLLGTSETIDLLRECYRPGESLGGAFGRLFSRLFRDRGVVLLDPSDAELQRIAEPVYRAAVEKSGDIHAALLERGKELLAAGYHEQVNVAEASSLLFAEENGVRTAIRRTSNGAEQFRIGQEKLDTAALTNRIASEPQRFSPNVLLRPIVQDYLLPTIVYTGGPAEVAYFAQAGVVYQQLLGRVTPIVPRFSATLLDAKAEKFLERYQLGVADVLHGPDHVRSLLAERALPAKLRDAFDRLNTSFDESLAGLQHELANLDQTLVDAAQHAGSKMKYQLDRLRARADAAELRRSEVLDRHATYLSNVIFPNKNLQERELGGIYFLARHGKTLLSELDPLVSNRCPDHQVIHI